MTKCPLCRSSKALFKQYLYDDENLCWDRTVLIYQCTACGLYYSVISKNLHEIYKNDYYVFGEYREKYDQAFAKHCCSWLDGYVKLSGKKLLDVGSGRGYFCEEAKIKKALVWGIEPITAVAIESHKRTGITIYNAYFEDFKITTKYDIITMWDVFEHFQDPRAILSKVKDALNAKGYFVMSVPNKGSIFSYISGAYWKGYNKYHVCHYTYKVIKRLLDTLGFEIVIKETFDNNILSAEGMYRIGIKDRIKNMAAKNSYLREAIIKRRVAKTNKNIFTGHNDYITTKKNVIGCLAEDVIKKMTLGDQLRIICRLIK